MKFRDSCLILQSVRQLMRRTFNRWDPLQYSKTASNLCFCIKLFNLHLTPHFLLTLLYHNNEVPEQRLAVSQSFIFYTFFRFSIYISLFHQYEISSIFTRVLLQCQSVDDNDISCPT